CGIEYRRTGRTVRRARDQRIGRDHSAPLRADDPGECGPSFLDLEEAYAMAGIYDHPGAFLAVHFLFPAGKGLRERDGIGFPRGAPRRARHPRICLIPPDPSYKSMKTSPVPAGKPASLQDQRIAARLPDEIVEY